MSILEIAHSIYRQHRGRKMAQQSNVHAVGKTLLPAILFLFVDTAAAGADPALPGTYSSLVFHSQSGDLLGYEVRLIPTNQATKAVVQVAEGDAGRIYIVDVSETRNRVEFEVPLASGMRGRFGGRLTKNGLEGVLVFPSGVTGKVLLSRTASYWEKKTGP